MKRWPLFALVLLVVGLFFYLLGKPATLSVVIPESAASTSTAVEPIEPPPVATGPRIKIGSVNIPVELAQTPTEVQKGLSGRLSLDLDKGMLFLFAKPDIYSFWMPDMHFPLDMVWIGSDRKVVGISADVSNDFDPANPKFYRPPASAQYVLEVNAGFAARTGIKIGDIVAFLDI